MFNIVVCEDVKNNTGAENIYNTLNKKFCRDTSAIMLKIIKYLLF